MNMQLNLTDIGIGDNGLLQNYLTVSNSFMMLQSNSNLLLTQPPLEVSSVDAGLATFIKNYQTTYRGKAQYFLHELMPEMIQSLTQAENFSRLSMALNPSGLNNIYQNKNSRNIYTQEYQELSQQATAYKVAAHTLASKLLVFQNTLETLNSRYQTQLTELITKLGVDISATNKEIDTLLTEINQNIEAIVKGGIEAGDGVVQIGTGIITIIKGKDTSDVTDYTVKGIIGIAEGTSTSIQAVEDLNINNKKLAEAYQTLAKENALLAVAKSVQAQTTLFMQSLEDIGSSVHDLETNWSKVQVAFVSFAESISNVQSQAEAQELANQAQEGTLEWEALGNQINKIKAQLAGSYS